MKKKLSNIIITGDYAMQLPPFKLERYFAKYEFKAPYLLCSSDCESRSVAAVRSLRFASYQGHVMDA